MSTYGSPLFLNYGLPESKPRWGFFAVSYILQMAALAALLCVTIIAPRIAPPVATHVELVAPDLTPVAKPAPPRPMEREVARIEAPRIALPEAPPKIEAPPVQQPQRVQKIVAPAEIAQPQIAAKLDTKVLDLPTPKATTRIIATNTFGSTAAPGPKAPAKTISTNTFGSSAPQTLQNISANKVQTGGFGDPNGIPANAHGNAKSIIAAAGSFDLPAGGGYGNGTGGTKGVRGTVASSGFGNGVAVQGNGGRGNQGHVQATSFVSVTVPPPTPAERRASAAAPVPSVPVSIQSKPTPVYTSEARELRVEGEVMLSVVFTASGQIRILNVVHGLGHGLDEAAQHAAQGVRFSPATRDGHPVDSNAILHIVFQLS